MVKLTNKQKLTYAPDGTPNIDEWLQEIEKDYALENTQLIERAIQFAAGASVGLTTFYGQPCIEQSIEIAKIILDLKMDDNAVAAAILTSTAQHTKIDLEKITAKTNAQVAKLVNSVLQMNSYQALTYPDANKNQTQIDRFRKLFLAMASDIRVILIKLAERTCVMRGIRNINLIERKRLAQETMDVYAPLANRLGIGQLKWELEDLAFHYIDPTVYKEIAHSLKERRIEREERVTALIEKLKNEFAKINVPLEITGRAKHIYSIYSKMQRKQLDIDAIFDASAVRILVPTIADCYTALSIAHRLYEHVDAEYDDYITHPKPNGYRSVHTAVIDEDGKYFEIQIRTLQMHEEAEHGVAAHWAYKENKPTATGDENKIAVLRELLAWHKDITKQTPVANSLENFLEDSVYVFTPQGEIIDLDKGATPLDFAYHIHSGLGHRCRGAKINGHIVPLTHALQTGDKIEIITIQDGAPSRDWLSKDAGYIKTSRARAKVAQWFKHQDQQTYIDQAKKILERELSRQAINQLPMSKIAEQLNFKDDQAMLAALGRGSLRLAQILHTLEDKPHAPVEPTIVQTKKATEPTSSFKVGNASDLLTRIARCCKPIPGDSVIGFITQGRGVSIHKQTCANIVRADEQTKRRLIDVNWNAETPGSYFTDLEIRGFGREELLKEITSLLANIKIDLIHFNSTINKANNLLIIKMTIQIHTPIQLRELLNQIKHLPNVTSVRRLQGS